MLLSSSISLFRPTQKSFRWDAHRLRQENPHHAHVMFSLSDIQIPSSGIHCIALNFLSVTAITVFPINTQSPTWKSGLGDDAQ